MLFLFNIAGYKLFFFYAQRHADQRFESTLAQGLYDSSQLVRLAIPLNMPYYSQTSFERVKGEVEVNGRVYKFVSRKIECDSLILLCLPDHQRSRLAFSRSGFVADALGLQTGAPDKKKPASSSLKSLPDTDYDWPQRAVALSPLHIIKASFHPMDTDALLSGDLPSIYWPPDQLSFS